jgi:hypothetical protein
MPHRGDFDGIKITAVPARFTAIFDPADFGNSHQPNILMNSGIVRLRG